MKETSSTLPLAILTTKNIQDKGVLMDVLVKDKDGRQQSRQRYLIQLGASPSVFSPELKKKTVVADTIKIVLTLSRT